MATMEEANEFFESAAAREDMRSTYREAIPVTTEKHHGTVETYRKTAERVARKRESSTHQPGNPNCPHCAKVTLQCNECGKKRRVSPNGTLNDRCPKCGGVDWGVL